MPLSRGAVFVATGFDKWGMTNAVASAHSIVAGALGGQAPGLHGHLLRPETVRRTVRLNLAAVAALVRGYARTDRDRLVPTAEAAVEDSTCRLVAVCTHLGGPLSWNDAEQSWDCALHGSRFAPDGSVLEGPATRPLRHRGSRGGDG
jgi:Rieske Fe-S protein